MLKAGRKEHKSPLLSLTSGYRSYDSQKKIYDEKYAEAKKNHPKWSHSRIVSYLKDYVAKPGSSTHEIGFAIDLKISTTYKNKVDDIPFLKKERAFGWLVDNASSYGFYNYYKEPWHWEYNPPNKKSSSK